MAQHTCFTCETHQYLCFFISIGCVDRYRGIVVSRHRGIPCVVAVPACWGEQSGISTRWLDTCFQAFNTTGFMYEKYNAFEVGVGGGGGEYVPQVGFGWSNAVALVLLAQLYPALGTLSGSAVGAPGAAFDPTVDYLGDSGSSSSGGSVEDSVSMTDGINALLEELNLRVLTFLLIAVSVSVFLTMVIAFWILHYLYSNYILQNGPSGSSRGSATASMSVGTSHATHGRMGTELSAFSYLPLSGGGGGNSPKPATSRTDWSFTAPRGPRDVRGVGDAEVGAEEDPLLLMSPTSQPEDELLLGRALRYSFGAAAAATGSLAAGAGKGLLGERSPIYDSEGSKGSKDH